MKLITLNESPNSITHKYMQLIMSLVYCKNKIKTINMFKLAEKKKVIGRQDIASCNKTEYKSVEIILIITAHTVFLIALDCIFLKKIPLEPISLILRLRRIVIIFLSSLDYHCVSIPNIHI